MSERASGSRRPELVRIADNVWIVDDADIHVAGLQLPIRMTIIRLANGDLLLHSPTRYSAELRHDIERLGTIRYFLAPGIAHWMFIKDWQAIFSAAIVVAVPGLAERKQVLHSGLRIDHELNGGTPDEWADEIETVLVSAPLFSEVALFHKPSRTLVLTDLIQNLRRDDMPVASRLIARALGILAPDAQAPAYLRLLLRLGGRATEQAARRLISFEPERVVFAHGEWFKDHGGERLRHAFRWLPEPAAGSTGPEGEPAMTGLSVVITGASSGIGRATALAFARQGASVVLAARREAVLEKLARECEAIGGKALAVATDVTDPEAVKRLAQKADEQFGGIDVWINNAGTGVFGPYQSADVAFHRRTVEVNLLGTMHGAFAVVPIFLRQKHGTLINNISVGGWVPTPFAAAYTASKFGIRGFTASLRQELAEHPDIHVCGVFPAMIDTPGLVHGANMSAKRLDPGPFLYQAEDVADTFVQLVRRPRDEVAVGWPARAGQIAYAGARGLTERMSAAMFRSLLSRARPAVTSEGSMFETTPDGVSTSGGWLARKSLPPAGQISRAMVVAGVALFALGTIRRMRRGRRRRA